LAIALTHPWSVRRRRLYAFMISSINLALFSGLNFALEILLLWKQIYNWIKQQLPILPIHIKQQLPILPIHIKQQLPILPIHIKQQLPISPIHIKQQLPHIRYNVLGLWQIMNTITSLYKVGSVYEPLGLFYMYRWYRKLLFYMYR
jgi:hypothetical protein